MYLGASLSCLYLIIDNLYIHSIRTYLVMSMADDDDNFDYSGGSFVSVLLPVGLFFFCKGGAGSGE